jgi:hypothetical protein
MSEVDSNRSPNAVKYKINEDARSVPIIDAAEKLTIPAIPISLQATRRHCIEMAFSNVGDQCSTILRQTLRNAASATPAAGPEVFISIFAAADNASNELTNRRRQAGNCDRWHRPPVCGVCRHMPVTVPPR